MAFALRDVMEATSISDAISRATQYPSVYGYNIMISSLFERITVNVEAVSSRNSLLNIRSNFFGKQLTKIKESY